MDVPRSATGLYRLWQQQGLRDDARQLLLEVANRFTEGFDTPDLKEPQGLLNEVSLISATFFPSQTC